jgi:hypothetical protein
VLQLQQQLQQRHLVQLLQRLLLKLASALQLLLVLLLQREPQLEAALLLVVRSC